MVDRLVELIVNIVLWSIQGATIILDANQKSSKRNGQIKSSPQVPPISPYPRAVLITTSSITFGNACERLVNIAFHTAQTFPTMMSSYADVHQYLYKELTKQYPDENFHIVIGENRAFGFSVEESQYFAEIEQERYRILIFTSKKHLYGKSDTHNADSQILFKWN